MSQPLILPILDLVASPQGEELATALLSLLEPKLAAELEAKALQKLASLGAAALRTGLADGTLLPDGQGGIISKAWAEDPRHQLNPDGTFKY